MSERHPIFRFLFTITVLLLLLLGFSFLFIEPGSGAWIVGVLSLVPLLSILVLIWTLNYIDWNPFDHIF